MARDQPSAKPTARRTWGSGPVNASGAPHTGVSAVGRWRVATSLCDRVSDQFRIGELLEPDDLAVVHVPDMNHARTHRFSGLHMGSRIGPDADNRRPAIDEAFEQERVVVPFLADPLEYAGDDRLRADIGASIRESGHLGPC